MKFRKLKKELLRRKLEKNNFFEDINFKSAFIKYEVKKQIVDWIFGLYYYKEIRVKKFKDLFKQLDEISFPIRIIGFHSSLSIEIDFIDKDGKKYYISKRDIYNYSNMQNYTIGRRNSSLEPFIDRDFEYKILKDTNIVLIQTSAMKLKEDGTNDDIVVNFHCDNEEHITEAILSSYTSNKKIKIKYPTYGEEFDKKVLSFLLNIDDVTWYYNVFPILKWLMEIIKVGNEISVSIIAEIETEISSQIDVKDNIVRKHIITKRISENEIDINKKILKTDLQEFLKVNTIF